MQAAIDEHERILETLRGDDRDAFCAAVNDHLQWSIALAAGVALSEPRAGSAGRRASSVWGTAVSVYFLAIFHRSSLGVAGLAAAERFHITASQLSTFTVLQLLVYAAMQIPVGVLLDRFGPQRLLVTGAVFMTAGAARLRLHRDVRRRAGRAGLRRHGRRDGVHQRAAADRLVVPADAQPDGHGVHRDDRAVRRPRRGHPAVPGAGAYGWTTTFVASASVGVLLGLLTVLLVRDVPPGAPSGAVGQGRADRRARPAGWRGGTRAPGSGCWSHFTTQFAANVMGLLWGFPFFVHAEHRLGRPRPAALLSLLVGVFIVGGPVIGGYITRHPWRRSTIVLSIVGAMALTWTVVLLLPGDAPLWLLCLLVVTTGLGGPGSMIGFDLARTFAPARGSGRPAGSSTSAGSRPRCSRCSASAWCSTRPRRGLDRLRRRGAYKWAMCVQYVFWVGGGIQVWRYRYRARAHLADTQPETFRDMSGLEEYVRPFPRRGTARPGRR